MYTLLPCVCVCLQMYAGNYSWLLYGDDDTVFFIDSVSELLQDFDPSLPYFITGMVFWQSLLILSSNFKLCVKSVFELLQGLATSLSYLITGIPCTQHLCF